MAISTSNNQEVQLALQHEILVNMQRIAEALEKIAQPKQPLTLGLVDLPTPFPIFVGGDNDQFCWYTLDKDSRQVPITKSAIAGRITSISLVDRQYKTDTTTKLDIRIAADRDYLIRCGLGTIASRCLLLSLWQLSPQSLHEVLTIAMRRGSENKVVFAEIYQGGARVQYEWSEDPDLLSMAKVLADRVNPGF